MSVAREILAGRGGIEVDVKALGRELRRLWEGAASESGPQVTRACTRNLVILAPDESRAAEADRLVPDITGRHPARVFVVGPAGADQDPDTLEARLSAHCMVRPGGRHVCCEQATLTVGRMARRRAAGAIVPLLVPDLPVVLWCAGRADWDDPLLSRLLDVADLVVVDSAEASDPRRAFDALLDHRGADRWAPGDLAWSRLLHWREAVARMFDAPDMAQVPATLERVVVRHHGARAQAALLAAWAADRIESVRRTPPDVVLETVALPAGARGPSIVAVELACASPPVRCVAEASHATSSLTLSVNLPEWSAPPSRSPCADLPAAAQIAMQLDAPGTDACYERALTRAVSLLVANPES